MAEDDKDKSESDSFLDEAINGLIEISPSWAKPLLKRVFIKFRPILLKIIIFILLVFFLPLLTAFILKCFEDISGQSELKKKYVHYVQEAFNIKEAVDNIVDEKLGKINKENYERLDYFQIIIFDSNFILDKKRRTFPFRLKQNQKALITISTVQVNSIDNKKCSAPERGDIYKVTLADNKLFNIDIESRGPKMLLDSKWWEKNNSQIEDDEIIELIFEPTNFDYSDQVSDDCKSSIKVIIKGSITVYKELFNAVKK